MLDDRREAFYDAHFAMCDTCSEGFDELSSRVLLDLLLTCDVVNQIVGRQMAAFGLSKSSFNVLMLLRHGPPEGMQLHDLGELLVVSRANITGLIDHLEQKGYVTRKVAASDRRVRHAKITPQAEALLDRFAPVHHANLKMLLQDLTTEEKRAIRGLLKRVRKSLRAHAAECDGPKRGVAPNGHERMAVEGGGW